MIKLYNHSSFPDDILKKVCQYAYRKTGCHGNVVVKVTRGGYRVKSRATQCFVVYRWFLEKRHYKKSDGSKKLLKKGTVNTDGGMVILQPLMVGDSLRVAEHLVRTAIHEFVHIRDFQQHRLFTDYNRRWANRPHEIRACNMTSSLMYEPDLTLQDLILELAIILEKTIKPKDK